MIARLWAAAALLVASGGSAEAGGAPVRCEGCSLVMIGLDAVRADRAPDPSLTPRLARFASGSVVFEQAISAAPWTLPSFMSLFTSQRPSSHRVVNKTVDLLGEVPARLAETNPRSRPLAAVLRDGGWRTAAFTGGAGLGREFGFDAGFEVYRDSPTFGGFDRTVPEALEWLGRLPPGARFFLFVHGYDAHRFHPGHLPGGLSDRFRELRSRRIRGEPVDATAEERARLVERYDAAVAALDQRLGPLLERLGAPDLSTRTVVIVTGDHGEELFDHGGVDHGMTLYDELIRVPLLVRLPGLRPRRVRSQVRTIDVMPTALDLLGLRRDAALAAQMEGASLAPALRGEAMRLDAVSETDFLLRASLRSLRTADGWKLVLDRMERRSSLFRLADDPRERRDLSGRRPELRRALEERLMGATDGAGR